MVRKATPVPKKKRGRPSAGTNNGESGESGYNRLLEKLLDENMWLREEPESEGQIASYVGIPKSTVREAVIALVRVGCLKRTPDGLVRDTMMADRLINLYAMRLRIEQMAMRQIFAIDDVRRQVIAEVLDGIRRQQEATINDRSNGGSNFMRWLHAGMEFHTAIVRFAGMEDEANYLKNLLVQVRVASFKKADEPEVRRHAVDQHETFVQLISDGPTLDDKPELVWHEFIANHLWESFRAALNSDDRHMEPRDEMRMKKMWGSIVKRAQGNPVEGL